MILALAATGNCTPHESRYRSKKRNPRRYIKISLSLFLYFFFRPSSRSSERFLKIVFAQGDRERAPLQLRQPSEKRDLRHSKKGKKKNVESRMIFVRSSSIDARERSMAYPCFHNMALRQDETARYREILHPASVRVAQTSCLADPSLAWSTCSRFRKP
ncbi:hypothetical protein PUN28_016242 [Cardiocondyla obscurior]|uniref:Uncharacterized protein n=1 Tax=Cardiocondyla obscurior TaxID=286306 RepID=A0AAW2ERK3_9HYME